jgi:hypothetical protein
MPSPFPGMDPYIEACGLWADFHNHFIEQISWQLADVAPPRYVIRTAERSYLVLVESEGKTKHPFLPDVSIATPRTPRKGGKKGGTAVAEAASQTSPHLLRAFVTEEHREKFIEIYETDPELRLVTTIEVLSPSNKQTGEGRDLYLRKRQSLLLSDGNLVELDLLRDGQRMPMLDPWPKSPYVLMVARGRMNSFCQVWEGSFQEPLPPIPVPLAKPDADLSLNLQPIIDAVYRRYRYEQSINYETALKPPLSQAEAAWWRRQRAKRPAGP